MIPVSPVLPGSKIKETVYAEHQAEYLDLPSIKFQDGLVLTRWRMTWPERLRAFLTGDVYMQQLTFNNPLQPISLQVNPPEMETSGVRDGKGEY